MFPLLTVAVQYLFKRSVCTATQLQDRSYGAISHQPWHPSSQPPSQGKASPERSL